MMGRMCDIAMELESLKEENEKLREAFNKGNALVEQGRRLIELQHDKIKNFQINEEIRELKIVELTEANKHLKDELELYLPKPLVADPVTGMF